MKDLKSAQFDPAAPYPEWAFAFGGNEFYCSSPRGHLRLHKGDWIVEFSTGERIVVNDATYQAYFKESPPDEPTAKALRPKLLVATRARTKAPASGAAAAGVAGGAAMLEGQDS